MATLIDRIDTRLKEILEKQHGPSLNFLGTQKDEIEHYVNSKPDTAYFLLEGLSIHQETSGNFSQSYLSRSAITKRGELRELRSRILFCEGSALKNLCYTPSELIGKPFQRLIWWKDTGKFNDALTACAYDSSKEGFVWSGPIRTAKQKAHLRHYFCTLKIRHHDSSSAHDSAIIYLKRQEHEYITLPSTRPAEFTELPAKIASGNEGTFANWMQALLKEARKKNQPFVISLKQILDIPTENLRHIPLALRELDKNYDIKIVGIKDLPDDKYMFLHLMIGKNYFIPPENLGFKRLQFIPPACAHENCWKTKKTS